MWQRFSYFCIGVAILLSGCLSRQVVPIAYVTGSPTPARAARSSDYGDTAKAIAFALGEELKLSSFETVLYVYPSLNDFKSGFVEELQGKPEQAAASSGSVALANCKHKKILVNGYWFRRVAWRSQVKTLAHEMTHVTQFAMGQWKCREAHAWITEGFANWMAGRVLERLSVDTFASWREEFLREMNEHRTFRALPSLRQLSNYADWEYMARSLGYGATYGQAFFAVDYLIQRCNLDAVVKYLSSFENSADREANFKAAFGFEFSAFEAEFAAHVQKLTT